MASQWSSIALNSIDIVYEFDTSVLISYPNEFRREQSISPELTFYVSKKLIHRAGSRYVMSVKEGMTFKLSKSVPQVRGFERVFVKEVTAEELVEAFGGPVEYRYDPSDNLGVDPLKEVIVRHRPEQLDPVKIEADASLRR